MAELSNLQTFKKEKRNGKQEQEEQQGEGQGK